jgi:hypothetical protein
MFEPMGGWSPLGVSTNFEYLFEWMLANKIAYISEYGNSSE